MLGKKAYQTKKMSEEAKSGKIDVQYICNVCTYVCIHVYNVYARMHTGEL